MLCSTVKKQILGTSRPDRTLRWTQRQLVQQTELQHHTILSTTRTHEDAMEQRNSDGFRSVGVLSDRDGKLEKTALTENKARERDKRNTDTFKRNGLRTKCSNEGSSSQTANHLPRNPNTTPHPATTSPQLPVSRVAESDEEDRPLSEVPEHVSDPLELESLSVDKEGQHTSHTAEPNGNATRGQTKNACEPSLGTSSHKQHVRQFQQSLFDAPNGFGAAGASLNSQRTPNVHICGLRRFKHHQNSTRRPPGREKSENGSGRGGKNAKFWALHPSVPHPSLSHPSGPHLWGPIFSGF